MKAFQIIRDIVIILACMCVILLTVEIVTFEARVANTVDRINQQIDPTPDPLQSTGCPFGPGQCGG